MYRLPFLFFGLAAFSGLMFAAVIAGRAPRLAAPPRDGMDDVQGAA